MTRLTTMFTVFLLSAGCSTGPSGPPHPARINHVVLIALSDDSDPTAVIMDCDRLLPDIPSVRSYWCGQHGDFGRSGVDAEYDLALCVGFDDDQGYADYLVHPHHVELVETWKPHFKWIRIHDVVDQSP